MMIPLDEDEKRAPTLVCIWRRTDSRTGALALLWSTVIIGNGAVLVGLTRFAFMTRWPCVHRA
jgi:hypothetical protein